MTDFLHQLWRQRFRPPPVKVAAAATSEPIDLGTASGFVVWSAGGIPTYIFCDAAGTALPGAAATNATIGTKEERRARWVKVTADTNDVVVERLS